MAGIASREHTSYCLACDRVVVWTTWRGWQKQLDSPEHRECLVAPRQLPAERLRPFDFDDAATGSPCTNRLSCTGPDPGSAWPSSRAAGSCPSRQSSASTRSSDSGGTSPRMRHPPSRSAWQPRSRARQGVAGLGGGPARGVGQALLRAVGPTWRVHEHGPCAGARAPRPPRPALVAGIARRGCVIVLGRGLSAAKRGEEGGFVEPVAKDHRGHARWPGDEVVGDSETIPPGHDPSPPRDRK